MKQRLVDVQTECVKLAEENVQLRQNLQDLRTQVKICQQMGFKDNVYWRTRANGKSEGFQRDT